MAGRRAGRLILAALLAFAVLLPTATLQVNAEVGDRALYLYHTHTRETARIVFKRNGVYDAKGLQQLDWFLRDWRNNQPTTMSPQLFDLIWEIYQKTGATQPINIVSAYRSPVTNGYLHSHSFGVANNSQHMLGHAMDIFIPGVPLARLRQVAMQQQVGGVGFYPTSGSPFVHVDVGPVRAWPRMTEAQLRATFPDGRTLHLPTDGVVLSQPGYAWAEAQWNACHAVPCNNLAALRGGAAAMGKSDMMQVAETSMTGKTFADIHAGINPGNSSIRNPGGDDGSGDAADDAGVTAGPEETAVTTVAIVAPVPLPRPAGLDQLAPSAGNAAAPALAAAALAADQLYPDAYAPGGAPAPAEAPPLPAEKSSGMMLATGEALPPAAPRDAVSAIAAIEAPMPFSRSLMPRGAMATDPALTAYAPAPAAAAAGPAEGRLEAIIRSETTGVAAPAGTALTNSVGSPMGLVALTGYVADRRAHRGAAAPVAFLPASFTSRRPRMVAPSFTADLARPVAMTSGNFAEFRQPWATDLDPSTELGPMVVRMGFHAPPTPVAAAGPFLPSSGFLVASR